MKLKVYEKNGNIGWFMFCIMGVFLLGIAVVRLDTITFVLSILSIVASYYFWTIKDKIFDYEITCDKFEVVKEVK